MESYSDILEHELESAVEVKDKDSLHRAVRLIAERMEAMQVQMDRRFDETDGKFRMLYIFLTPGFTIVTTAMMLINILG